MNSYLLVILLVSFSLTFVRILFPVFSLNRGFRKLVIDNENSYLRRPNLAPQLQFDSKLCKKSAMWGKTHSGGWMVCLDTVIPSQCVVYSFGLGADWSFDNAAESVGCEVHGFDPSNKLWKDGMHGQDYSHFDYSSQYPSKLKIFHNWGLGSAQVAVYSSGGIPQEWPGLGDPALSKTNTEPWEMKSVKQTMLDLKHTKEITVLKIDVEGAEWDAIAAYISDTSSTSSIPMASVKQLLVEWHWDPDSRLRNKRHRELLKKIESMGYRAWNIERHQGSDCCLDISYIWTGDRGSQ